MTSRACVRPASAGPAARLVGNSQQSARDELVSKRRERASLSEEVQQLREQLNREQAQTQQALQEVADKIKGEKRENTRLQIRLLQGQLGNGPPNSETELVKREVAEKSTEILAVMRELQEQQKRCFEQVQGLTSAMLNVCAQPMGTSSLNGLAPTAAAGEAAQCQGGSLLLGTDASLGIHGGLASLGKRRLSRTPSREPGSPGGVSRSESRSPTRGRSGSPSGSKKDFNLQAPGNVNGDWFRAMKANLEQFGHVEVFLSESAQECMSCCEKITTAYRVRPRLCDHVFHVECLLQWWTEGTCPVCGLSFAPDGKAGSGAASGSVQGAATTSHGASVGVLATVAAEAPVVHAQRANAL